MRSHGLGRKDLQKNKNKGEDKRERKLTGASKNGGCRYSRNKYCGHSRTGAVDTAEKCAESAVGMGATGMAGAGIPMPAATLGPSKVSASRELGIQMKRKYI